jgi:hypothetical protein
VSQQNTPSTSEPVPASEFQRTFATLDLPEATAQAIGVSRMDLRHAHLDRLLDEDRSGRLAFPIP